MKPKDKAKGARRPVGSYYAKGSHKGIYGQYDQTKAFPDVAKAAKDERGVPQTVAELKAKLPRKLRTKAIRRALKEAEANGF